MARVMSESWFERLFGFSEKNRQTVHDQLEVVGDKLRSKNSNEQWTCGRLEMPTLVDLRERVKSLQAPGGKLKLSEVVANSQALHQDRANTGAMFQVASQFNLLEMSSPEVIPEQGITIYQHDCTQGPTCAIACAAGTVYRNYFVNINGQLGQTATRQIDCLAEIGQAIGNSHGQLWKIHNGYALPSEAGLAKVEEKLQSMSDGEFDDLRSKLRIGLQWNTQVTLDGCDHLVSQAYCSALPIGYSSCSTKRWERFARLVLEASYEATFSAAAINGAETGNWDLFLTLVGGGVFCNDHLWILDAIRRACEIHQNFQLNVKIVSFGGSNSEVRKLVASTTN